MAESEHLYPRSSIPESFPSHHFPRLVGPGAGILSLKKRGHAHGNRSWIKIDRSGNSKVMELDKATLMSHCCLPARDLRLLDPVFIYPSTILGREKAIVVNLEQIRCIITADEVILMNSLDGSVAHYNSELCKRLQTSKDQSDDLPFEFKALELALELTCITLDAQVKELEMEIRPVLDELTSSISTLNLERVRRFKGLLLALTQRVQKVCDEIEQLMDDDGDMAEMYLTEKKQKKEACHDYLYDGGYSSSWPQVGSKSAPVSPVGSTAGASKLQRALSSLTPSRHGSFTSSSIAKESVDQLEMLLEAYFVVIDNTQHKLLSVISSVFCRLVGFSDLICQSTYDSLSLSFHCPILVKYNPPVTWISMAVVSNLNGEI